MRKKLKPNQDLEAVQSDLIETVCYEYNSGMNAGSIRAVAKALELSPMKVRKILITGNAYSTELSTEIGELYKDGKTVSEIADILSMTIANVNSMLPYERIIYNMDERSVGADRQQRYRDRKKGLSPAVEEKEELPKVERVTHRVIQRVRNRTMIIVIGRKLRKLIPSDVLDDTSDPLARDKGILWNDTSEPMDPDKMIWCAELTTSGRGKGKKTGVVLMSANCGFAVISTLPPIPELTAVEDENMTWEEKRTAEEENKEKLESFRAELETVFIDAIRSGFLSFALPENRVLDYTDTVRNIELVKGKASFPATRLEDLIERELQWKPGVDPLDGFNVRGNWTNRKFGNSGEYRYVDSAVQQMLGMSAEESEQWLDAFLRPLRENMTGQQGS